MKKLAVVLAFSLGLVAVVAGCLTTSTPLGSAAVSTAAQDSPRRQALATLQSGKMVYDQTFTALAILDSQGKLQPKAKVETIKYGEAYLTAHNAAVQALLENKQPSLAAVQATLDQFLAGAARAGVKPETRK